MVRVFIKGGVWKNSEDEILKAAVMKYGKQQWARVASLLNRKSAKQCKARWNEWLDPSVRKVEWSREEDEKLLHLAKLMPAQWRTIGPLVGRTGGQCQERYERLLDEAAGGSQEEDGHAQDGGAMAARKLRPGEIDPHPETKPARPDPIDMDEDEVEMLQEARARLANTQGKKAKRKAREKMLAEAKRLADLQKRRELKAAGLLSGAAKSRSKKRLRDIDLGVEIPFHKPAPAGFHATGDEDERAESIRNQRLKDVDYKRIHEMQYRQRDREAKERQKREEARLRSLERSNMQYVVAEVAKRNDPIASRKRGVLNMPEPTIADDELRRVAKASEEERDALAALAAAGGSGEGVGVTTALLGDYSDRPLPTPMRTPASSSLAGKPSRSEVIQREAMNLRALSTGQTPLLGEENAELLEGGAGTGVGLGGTAAAAAFGATPMLGSASVADDDATAGMKRKASSQTPLTQATSHRDELGLNVRNRTPLGVGPVVTADDASVGASSFGASTFASRHMSVRELAKEERRRAKKARKELEDALANLPAPQFEYELAVPEDVPMEEADEDERIGRKLLVKDTADVDAEEKKRWQREAEKFYEEQSSVIKRPDLPRPKCGIVLERLQDNTSGKDVSLAEAEKLINEELITLISHDAYAHPSQIDKKDPVIASLSEGKGKKDKRDKRRKLAMAPETHLDYIPEESLKTAQQLLDDELRAIVHEKRELISSTTGRYYENDSDVMDAVAADTIRAANRSSTQLSFSGNGWAQKGDGDGPSPETLYAEYKAVQNATNAVAKACSKLEQKLEIQTGGYNQRSQSLIDSSLQSFAMLQHSKIEAIVYSRLRSHETKGAELRIERLKEEIELLEDEETRKQKKYGELVHTKNRLQLKIKNQDKK